MWTARIRRNVPGVRPSTQEQLVKRPIYITLIALVLLLVACCGWAVEGVRWVATRRLRLAPAA
jgi:hypothetical protein